MRQGLISTFIFLFVFSFAFSTHAAHFETVTLNPGTVNFPNTDVGEMSASQTVTVTISPDTQTVNLIGATLTDQNNFTITQDNCAGVQLKQAGPQSCTVDVAFNPTLQAFFVGNLVILQNGEFIANFGSLVGQGAEPEVDLSDNSIDFGQHEVGTTTDPVTVTVTNTGTGPLEFSDVAITSGSANFTLTMEDCTTNTPIAPNGTCTLSVTFSPDSVANFNGAVSLTDNAPDSPQQISLSGSGAAQGGLNVNPSNLNFGALEQGMVSAPLTITISNSGTGDITGIMPSSDNPDFTVTQGTCPAFPFTLNPAASCEIDVTFTANFAGGSFGLVTVSSDVGDLVVDVEGIGFVPGSASASVSANNIDFGEVQVGTQVGPQIITVTNNGDEPLVFSGITLEGAESSVYSIVDDCMDEIIAIDASCEIQIFFSPQSNGTFDATVVINSNAQESPQVVTITGVGIGGGSNNGVSGGGCSLHKANQAQLALPLLLILSALGSLALWTRRRV